ncbi:hypothetical protein HF086_014653 [Spodoptera exigua]|uniref:Uncharacterized protein n=1 Tax=Spodoptera exigua TaxID=7107 RepID=A0A922M5R8_SPOEX|nr:hypothetical protein HF086_014653 [Spodoptera exigua]
MYGRKTPSTYRSTPSVYSHYTGKWAQWLPSTLLWLAPVPRPHTALSPPCQLHKYDMRPRTTLTRLRPLPLSLRPP